uniref:Concentrative nucleoside transporter N-terminal domain-containing protein n=1 Tax=Romanomermis culicivorax TaxID=13658 RepID=A0A915L5C3_ROMCU
MADLVSPKNIYMTNGNSHTSTVHITEDGHQNERKLDAKIEGQKTKLEKIQKNFDDFCKTYHGLLSMSFYTMLSSLYVVYLGFALAHDQEKAAPVVIVSIVFGLGVFYFKVLKVHYGKAFMHNIWNPSTECMSKTWSIKFIRWITYGCFLAAFILYLIIDTADNRNRLIPLGGMIFYLVACFVFSTNPARVRWRPVVAGIVMQFVVGLLVLRWPLGLRILTYIAEKTTQFLDYAQHGTKFVYGFLADPPNICNMNAVFAFTVLQTLLYFGSVIALLYYFGVMQFILHQMAWVMQFTLGTTAAESLNAAGCIFLGMTEGPLMIRPYFAKMTRSELHTVFASGFACVTGSLLAAYINFGSAYKKLSQIEK